MIEIKNIKIEKEGPLVFILGPCVIESEEIAMKTAEALVENCTFPFIYKSSFDKANRSSIKSYRGPGIKEGLRILQKVKDTFDIPVTTDIHLPEQAEIVADVIDLIQIPAFLCRQTDLLTASAKTGLPLHVKKGQFLAPLDMRHVVCKIKESGGKDIILTDRGSTFGYNNLVSDMRAIPIMKSLGAFVCYDATHSLQLPGGMGLESGGERRYLPYLSRAAVAAGADLVYMETHPDPKNAKCDSATQMPLDELFPLLNALSHLKQEVQKHEYVAPS